MCAHTVNMKIPAIHFGSRYCSRLAGPEFTFKMVCRVAGVMSGWQGSRTHTHSFISETQTDENDNSGEHQSECVWLWRGLEIEMVISVYLIIIKSGATTAAEVTRTLLLMAMLSMFRRTAKPYLHKSVLFFNEDIMPLSSVMRLAGLLHSTSGRKSQCFRNEQYNGAFVTLRFLFSQHPVTEFREWSLSISQTAVCGDNW